MSSPKRVGMIVDLVLPESRIAHASTLMEMHHDRKRVFVDTLGWKLPSPGSWLEVDDFDNEHSVYLLARSQLTGRHAASVRLLPSTQRHMLGSLFSGLCSGPVPVSEDCWEISRLVTAPPEAVGTSVVKIHRLLAVALIEFAQLNSIRHYTLVTEAQRTPALLSIGWKVRPLGLPTRCHGLLLQALQICVLPDTLSDLKSRFRIAADVLRSTTADRRAA